MPRAMGSPEPEAGGRREGGLCAARAVMHLGASGRLLSPRAPVGRQEAGTVKVHEEPWTPGRLGVRGVQGVTAGFRANTDEAVVPDLAVPKALQLQLSIVHLNRTQSLKPLV